MDPNPVRVFCSFLDWGRTMLSLQNTHIESMPMDWPWLLCA